MAKKTKNKNLKIRVSLTIIAVIILIVSAFYFYAGYKDAFKENSEETKNGDFDFYDSGLCRCLEKNKPVCNLDGFEYNETRKLCVNSERKSVTYPTLSCSRYECSGEIYSFDNEINAWGNEI
jgi:hypothetical protein